MIGSGGRSLFNSPGVLLTLFPNSIGSPKGCGGSCKRLEQVRRKMEVRVRKGLSTSDLCALERRAYCTGKLTVSWAVTFALGLESVTIQMAIIAVPKKQCVIVW